jgi:hypothetical protein
MKNLDEQFREYSRQYALLKCAVGRQQRAIAAARRKAKRRLVISVPMLIVTIVAGVWLASNSGWYWLGVFAGAYYAGELDGRRRRAKKAGLPLARIHKPPLSSFDWCFRLFWSTKTYERVFKPARAELLFEYFEALKAGEIARARWIRWGRGPFTLIWHALSQVPMSLAKRFREMFELTK